MIETNRQMFMRFVAQTSYTPLNIEVEKAQGVYLYGPNGEKYLDTVSGISVANVGHCHPKVVEAVKNQVDKYMHLTVYGEFIQCPQVLLAKKMVELLPENLNSVFFVNSGSEATDGSIKLAKRYTHRPEVVAFKGAYHGSTIGAMSVWGDEYFKSAYRPLMPGVKMLRFNNFEDLQQITDNTACVLTEPIQSEGGLNLPENGWLTKLRERCNETGTLLIFDEVQMGWGRTGKMFGFENFNVVPDIVNFAKGLGGGMPIGAFVANKKIMEAFCDNPILGHITTFGGHPVSAAAALANINVILDENLVESANDKGDYFEFLMKKHSKVLRTWGLGLFRGVEVDHNIDMFKFLHQSLNHGIFTDLFIFRQNAFRFAPPLIINKSQIEEAVEKISATLDEL
ncbi:MAG: aspartate aminotransferase family protein [Bacteroidales bacterium]|nr:aspartate aminotransferase family protein [Bacteroidales bacterium]